MCTVSGQQQLLASMLKYQMRARAAWFLGLTNEPHVFTDDLLFTIHYQELTTQWRIHMHPLRFYTSMVVAGAWNGATAPSGRAQGAAK